MDISPKVAQLLVSRVCHDLVGSVSAVNAGVELAHDAGGNVDGETLALIDQSAKQAGHRLAFFRMALGMGGASGDTISQSELARVAGAYLGEGRVKLTWAEGGLQEMALAPAKVVLNLIMVAVDALPRGGTVNLELAPVDGGLGVALSCAGEGAGLNAETLQAFNGETGPESLSAHTVVAYFCAVLVQNQGGKLEHSVPEAGQAQLACVLPT